MYLRRIIAVLIFLSSVAFAGTPGTFRGTVHEGADIKPGWIYVEAINGHVRLVDIRRANVHFEDPASDDPAPAVDPKQPRPKLRTGTEVRVTAEQDKRGYWHASEIEVLRETSRK